ncbi:hypothetical protein NNJEOMEG_02024 [Fundidesulfovibrio magnetotacticus]|uniref:Glycosyltransferase RgtA/B/C/D-like domain-containing protein n=2 Tax=Fundidesulfovibrio magnetotacticus TaxID=2730080 RepID=A0A6V8LR41_9BACT|nr:hypothetical protein NNJEOMEG_02024 [Fundidesulfovibrio magnetotacticus]
MWLQAALVVAAGSLLAAFSERIYVNNGLGWDGGVYAHLALRFDEFLATGKPPYPVSYFRYLPSALVFLVMKASGAAMTVPGVIVAFQAVNIALYALMALAWNGIASTLGIGPRGSWTGFLFLFVNYAVLKFSFYYPTLTDSHGLAYATFMLWAYVAGRRWTLVLLSAAGLFVWPTLLPVGACLAFFPRKDLSGGKPRPWIAGLVALAALAGAARLVRVVWVEGVEQVFYTMLPLSFALSFLFLGALLFSVWSARGLFETSRSRREMLLTCAGLALAALGLVLLDRLAPETFDTLRCYAREVLLHGSRRPLEFLVAHTLYLGPVWLVALCMPLRAGAGVARLGWGMALAVTLMGFQAINPLTRQCIVILPFLTLLAVLALEDLRPGKWFLAGFTLLSLLFSKVWYRMNYNVDTSVSGEVNPVFWPRFTDSTGYYMKTPDYAVQGAFLLFCLAFLFLYFRTVPRAPEDKASQGGHRAP